MRRCLLLLLLVGCLALVSCGGSQAGSLPPTPEPAASAAGDTPEPTDPIARAAECAFPERMRVGQPATVRFSIFTPGNQPNALPSAASELEALTLPQRPDLEVWVAVTLNVNGMPVQQDTSRQVQRLNERSNIWVWEVTPDTTAPVLLQPIVDVEYRTAEGQVVERREAIWADTYTVSQVVGEGYVSTAAAWVGSSIQELIVGFIGALLLKVGTGARDLVGQRMGKKSSA